MKKNLLFILPFLFIVAGCNQGTKENADAAKLTVNNFEKEAGNHVEKAVVLEGTVLHTCKHGGKRLFLVDGTDSIRVEVDAGKEIPMFDEKLVGSRLRIFGTVKELRVDEKYLNDWENELKKSDENHEAGIHSGAKGHEDQAADEKFAQVNSLRDDLKKSGKDHLSFYSVEASRYEEIK